MREHDDSSRPAAEPPRRGMQLYTKILIGLVLGSLGAVLAKSTLIGPVFADHDALVEFGTRWVQPIGDLFIRAIVLTVVPLVFASIAAGVYSLGDIRTLGRLGGRTIVVFLSTSLAAALIGTGFYLLFQPGGGISAETRDLLAKQFEASANKSAGQATEAAERFSGSALQILVDLVPTNIVLAAGSNRDLLQIILFAVMLGVALTLIPAERARPVAALLEGINDAMTKIIEILMLMAPYGVFALVFMVVTKFGTDVLLALAIYTVVVLAALLAQVVFVYMPLLRVVARRNPIEFIRRSREIWITAFSTSSSSATLPTTLRLTEEQLGVPRSICAFVLPLGATINMAGTTIYQVIGVHFVAQVWGVELGTTAMITLIVISIMMAIGAAGVPGGVIPLLYVTMAAVGLPEAMIPLGIALLLGMDRPLDMCRSAINVIGDSVTAVVVASLEPAQPAEADPST
ncbi:dicarboxylate/amino acid:cation symporter [Nannocystaceae bacterium ST9]